MKTIYTFLSLLFVVFSLRGAEPFILPHNTVLSETRQKIFIGFWNGISEDSGISNAVDFSVDKSIKYGFGTAQSVPYDVFALNDEYGCSISVKSESGQDVARTSNGQEYGGKFLKVTSFDRKQLDYSNGRGNGGYQSPYLNVAAVRGVFLSRELPPLEKLFKFDKPGRYIVLIQLQCFVGPYGESNATNVNLVRFPLVKLQVIKKDDGK